MGEKRSIYLDEQGILSLDFIRHFFRTSLFRQSNDSEIISSALQLYLWFIRQVRSDVQSCPNPLCSKSVANGDSICKNCGTLLKWIPTFAPLPPDRPSNLAEELALAQKRMQLALGKAHSPAGTLTVKVDKSSFGAGESITVTGTVPAVIKDVPVAIQVFNPKNMMYTIALPTPNPDGTYSFEFKVGGKLGINGIYTVKATYSGQSVQTTFEFTSEVRTPRGKARVQFEGHVFNLRAFLSNGSIQSIEVDPDFTSIIISVSTTDQDGELTITLLRQLIDARINEEDDDFIVLIDGEEADFEEIETTSTERTLKIPIPAGAEEIEIIGTQIIGSKK